VIGDAIESTGEFALVMSALIAALTYARNGSDARRSLVVADACAGP
jgi:hypothetical protein